MFHVLVAAEEEEISRLVKLFGSHQFPHMIKFSKIEGFDEYSLAVVLDYQLMRYVQPWIRQYLMPFGMVQTRVLSEGIQMNSQSIYEEKQPTVTLGDLREMGEKALGQVFHFGLQTWLVVRVDPIVVLPLRTVDPIMEENTEVTSPDDTEIRLVDIAELSVIYTKFFTYAAERNLALKPLHLERKLQHD